MESMESENYAARCLDDSLSFVGAYGVGNANRKFRIPFQNAAFYSQISNVS